MIQQELSVLQATTVQQHQAIHGHVLQAPFQRHRVIKTLVTANHVLLDTSVPDMVMLNRMESAVLGTIVLGRTHYKDRLPKNVCQDMPVLKVVICSNHVNLEHTNPAVVKVTV
jgi:fumarate hydratase class II